MNRSRILAPCVQALIVTVFCLTASAAPAREPAKLGAASSATGVVEGIIVYQPDASRPWRFGRYYIKDAKKGLLAEAVVALDAASLAGVPAAAAAEPAVVDQKDFQFTPETIAIRAGQSVKFLNSDKELHNVNAFHPRHSFNVVMPAGGEHIEKFSRASGIQRPYRIGCVYHSAMRSWVFVFDHPWFQVTGGDGRFRLEGIPPGQYTLEMSHPAGQLRWSQAVEVKAGQTVPVEIRVSPDNLPKKP